MSYGIQAACGSHKGRVRRKHEDNFWFNGRYLPVDNQGCEEVLTLEGRTSQGRFLAVFDGMGGEALGEVAAWSAAVGTERYPERKLFQKPEEYLDDLVQQLNLEVFSAAKAVGVERSGSTLVGLYLERGNAYSVNLGDSRGFLFREGRLRQTTVDHNDGFFGRRKPRLTQYLGIDPMELILEPHIEPIALERGDRFLLCSDGLTDMVSEERICQLLEGQTPALCVEALIREALEQGGRDNITVLVIFVT